MEYIWNISEDDDYEEYVFDTNDTDIIDYESSECMSCLIYNCSEIG